MKLAAIRIEKSRTKKLRIFLTGGAYAPYAPCMATPLSPSFPMHYDRIVGLYLIEFHIQT